MVSMVIDPINQSFCSFSVCSDNGRILSLEGEGGEKMIGRGEVIAT